MPGAFKLDHLQPIKPLWFRYFSNFSTFILGSQFLLPRGPIMGKGKFSQPTVRYCPLPWRLIAAASAPRKMPRPNSLPRFTKERPLCPLEAVAAPVRSSSKKGVRSKKGGLQRAPLQMSNFTMTQASTHESIFSIKL